MDERDNAIVPDREVTMKDACKRGHPFVDGSFWWNADGTRKCKVCATLTRDLRKAKAHSSGEASADAPKPLKRLAASRV
jgi:hypothetical protein